MQSPPEPSITEPRVSFTLRRLLPESSVPNRQKAPPVVHPNQHASSSPSLGTHDGILVLTDSIGSLTRVHMFSGVEGHRCIKKDSKQLVNIFQFESEFKYRKMVVISCGVNDMSCYGLRGRELADKIGPRLEAVCRNHPGTTFIFNSVLYTRHSWLNRDIDILNGLMFDLSICVNNFNFRTSMFNFGAF